MSVIEALDWLKDVSDVRGPHSVLTEYADAITTRTGGRLIGRVESLPIMSSESPSLAADKIIYRIDVEVPGLRGYRTTLFETDGSLDSEWTPYELEVLSAELDAALNSDEVKETVRGLLSASS